MRMTQGGHWLIMEMVRGFPGNPTGLRLESLSIVLCFLLLVALCRVYTMRDMMQAV